MSSGEFKDLPRRTASDKLLRDKAFHSAKNLKYEGYQRGLALMTYKFFDESSLDMRAQSEILATRSTFTGSNTSGDVFKNENMLHQKLSKELHKPNVRTFEKRKVYSSFKDNIWVADIADMQLISKFNKGIRFYYVLLISSVNMHGLFLQKTRKVLQLLMLFRKYQLRLIVA